MGVCTEIEHSNGVGKKMKTFYEHDTTGGYLRPKTGFGYRRPTHSPFIILIIVLIVHLSDYKLHNIAEW